MYTRALCLLAMVAVVFAAEEPVEILSQNNDISPDGSFVNEWQSANGISHQEQGVLKNAGQKDAEAQEVQGSSSWTAPDGTKINLAWVANENGVVFQGEHLPTPPPNQPIPLPIQRALEWIAAHPAKEE